MRAAFLFQDASLPVVNFKSIQWNTRQHMIITRDRMFTLTTTEYRLLFPLRHGVPVTYSDLAYLVYNSTVDEKVRVMMDEHIDNIRGKLQGTGIYLYSFDLWEETEP